MPFVWPPWLHVIPDMGYPWSGMKTRPSDHSCRGLTVAHQESGRALARHQSTFHLT